MKKICLLLVFVMLLGAFASCEKTDPVTPPTDSGTSDVSGSETDAPPVKETGFLAKDGAYYFVTESGLDAEKTNLLNALKGLGFNVTEAENEASAVNTVLIGKTGQPETDAALSGLGEGEYVLAAENGKLVLAGNGAEATKAAVSDFIRNALRVGTDKVFADGTKVTGKIEKAGAFEAVKPENSAEKRPTLIKTVYPTEETVVATVIATEDCGADPTGEKDSTSAIQKALTNCGSLGGGTVFLPAGRYLVSSSISIPSGVTLRGDWQDPDTTPNPEYGTIIIAKPKAKVTAAATRSENALIRLNPCSGAVGLTVYYPEQKADKPVRQGYTFLVGQAGEATIENVTLINSYRGIGVGPEYEWHELMQIRHVRMCALETGLEMHHSSDVGCTCDVKISPAYWLSAGCGFDCENAADLRATCMKDATGIILGDLDDETLSELYVEGCKTGIEFTTLAERTFWGVIYGLDIVNCGVGMDVKSISGGNTALIANARIEGTEAAVINRVERTPLRFADVTLKGKAEGFIINEEDSLAAYKVVHGTHAKPADHLYIADLSAMKDKKADASDALQAVLNEAGKTGGVVYVASGIYCLYKPVTVPAGVELRGTAAVPGRDQDGYKTGTVFLTYVTDAHAVTLGENAGVSGLRIWCPVNDPSRGLEKIKANDPTIGFAAVKGTGKGVYAVHTVIVAGYVGFDFTGCDDHLVNTCTGCCFLSFAKVGGKNGTVEECLDNPNFLQRRSLDAYFDPDLADKKEWAFYHKGEGDDPGFTKLRDELLREYCVTYDVVDAENEMLLNDFVYGARTLVRTENSSALVINGTQDYLKAKYPMFEIRNSRVAAINALRIFGTSLLNVNSELDIYNRNDRDCIKERPYHSSIEFEDHGTDILVSEYIPLSSCDALPKGMNQAKLTKNANYVKKGSGALIHENMNGTGIVLEWHMDPTDLSEYVEKGYLHFWVWTSKDISGQNGSIELGSGGTCDVEESNWTINCLYGSDGWHEVFLPLAGTNTTGGATDFTRVDFMRFYLHNCENLTIAIDDISIALEE
ncbi:MAG: glycoside hydrolase family 55 protein [Lachnospiraceae bacterium]|nr:glycoside hydrolase family 55 protein [Lachnospiraceae bacterium]